MSIDRYLVFKIKNWQKIYFRPRVAMIAGFCLALFFFGINSNVLFTFWIEYPGGENGTLIAQCYIDSFWMNTWNAVIKITTQMY